MKKICIILLITLTSLLVCKVPFKTVYLEIKKVRLEGDANMLRNAADNMDKLERYESYQKIWVNVEENSYLMIEEPAEGNDLIQKYGKLKYKDRHYTLDYDLNFAWDGTGVESEMIFDNYTLDEPNYLFYKAKLKKKLRIKTADGVKRKAHLYTYVILNPADEEQTNAYIDELNASDMPQEDKDVEISAAKDALNKKATRVAEWIWVNDEKIENQMFLRKHELTPYMKIELDVTKVVVDEKFDYKIFENTLSQFKVKKIK